MVTVSDPRVHQVPLRENHDPLEDASHALPTVAGHGASDGGNRYMLRSAVIEKLARASKDLDGASIAIVEGFRPTSVQAAEFAARQQHLSAVRPHLELEELERETSIFVAPPTPHAPHVSGGAVDLTLVDRRGRELDLGCPVDGFRQGADLTCFFACPDIPASARELRSQLATVLTAQDLVNYPSEWWHWSYGDRYWAYVTGHGAAIYGAAGAASNRPQSPRT